MIGVDMTDEMLTKSRATVDLLGLGHVTFRDGFAESLPVDNGWADAVISNGVIARLRIPRPSTPRIAAHTHIKNDERTV